MRRYTQRAAEQRDDITLIQVYRTCERFDPHGFADGIIEQEPNPTNCAVSANVAGGKRSCRCRQECTQRRCDRLDLRGRRLGDAQSYEEPLVQAKRLRLHHQTG